MSRTPIPFRGPIVRELLAQVIPDTRVERPEDWLMRSDARLART
jgi:hypothetical protein